MIGYKIIKDHNIDNTHPYLNNFAKKTFQSITSKELKEYNKTYDEYIEELNKYPTKNTINLNIDQPISSQFKEKDILWHKTIAQRIFDLLLWFDMSSIKGAYTLGLVWEWWSGKSWVLNMLKNDWVEGRNDMQWYQFSPWNYNKDDLIQHFFSDLAKELNVSNIPKLFKRYSSLITSIDQTKIIGNLLNLLVWEPSFQQLKDEINKKLSATDRKIVVVIDDLDRCDPDEVMMMFNIVKNLGDFKNIIYILAYDKDNVLKVINDKKFWENYLDKIINTEIFMPISTNQQLSDYFNLELKNNFIQIYNNKFNSEEDNNISFEKIFNDLFWLWKSFYKEEKIVSFKKKIQLLCNRNYIYWIIPYPDIILQTIRNEIKNNSDDLNELVASIKDIYSTYFLNEQFFESETNIAKACQRIYYSAYYNEELLKQNYEFVISEKYLKDFRNCKKLINQLSIIFQKLYQSNRYLLIYYINEKKIWYCSNDTYNHTLESSQDSSEIFFTMESSCVAIEFIYILVSIQISNYKLYESLRNRTVETYIDETPSFLSYYKNNTYLCNKIWVYYNDTLQKCTPEFTSDASNFIQYILEW